MKFNTWEDNNDIYFRNVNKYVNAIDLNILFSTILYEIQNHN